MFDRVMSLRKEQHHVKKMQTAKAQVSLRICAGSPESLLLAQIVIKHRAVSVQEETALDLLISCASTINDNDD